MEEPKDLWQIVFGVDHDLCVLTFCFCFHYFWSNFALRSSLLCQYLKVLVSKALALKELYATLSSFFIRYHERLGMKLCTPTSTKSVTVLHLSTGATIAFFMHFSPFSEKCILLPGCFLRCLVLGCFSHSKLLNFYLNETLQSVRYSSSSFHCFQRLENLIDRPSNFPYASNSVRIFSFQCCEIYYLNSTL